MNKDVINTKMDIVACVDKWYVMPTGVMLYSICYNNQNVDIVFHIIVDESVSEKDKEDLKETICKFNSKRVEFYPISSLMVKEYPNPFTNGPTPATYYRLFLTEILPNSIDKVIYLDGDIVVRKSLLSLWNIDMSDYAIAAAPDICSMEKNFKNIDNVESFPDYFNAGVLLINLRAWRKQNITQVFCDYIRDNYDKIYLHDQDVLNEVFRDKKIILPLMYNYQQHFLLKMWKNDELEFPQEVKETREDPVIIHYSGMMKPWDRYVRCECPYNSSFYRYQNLSKWKGCRVDRRSRRLRIKNYIADSLRKLKIKAPLDYKFIDILPID